MQKIIKQCFLLSLMGFVLIGILLVLGQVFGLIIQSSAFIIKSNEYLSTIAFTLSAIAAILGFVLHYIKVDE